MSFDQIASAFSGGKPRASRLPVNCNEDVEWYRDNWRKVHGLED